ncbi:MAG: type II secretion system F family protein, partial [Verrucomicrobia bacterium]|nr:type II secretion system F family protein [Verrucomicrobiota bacterium]
MNTEEFAFFNQQLAAMLRTGIPLEGALKRLATEMRRGTLRDEVRKLEADLATGRPLGEAIAARKLPELYVRMVQAGAKAGDLPGTLTLLADHYQETWTTWTRLKGLLVYPAIVLVAALALSALLTVTMTIFAQSFFETGLSDHVNAFDDQMFGALVVIWLSPALLAGV